MSSPLTPEQLTGRDESHLVEAAGVHRLHRDAAAAFAELQRDAAAAGFELAIASSYRSFDRQLAIFNGKAAGARPVHDDAGRPVDVTVLDPARALAAILRFSALPGTSRHHWGTDLDVYDAAAVPADYAVQLTPAEVAPGGVFDPLHRWLDARMAAGKSHGFFRPYAEDRGGVAPERWHLSFAPLARNCTVENDPACLRAAWDGAGAALLLRGQIERDLPALLARFVRVPDSWCEPSRRG